MFSNCGALTSLNLANWDTSNVEYMNYTFNGMWQLQSINLTNWNTSKVVSMEGMFMYDSQLQTLDITSFNTSNVTDMSHMFRSCNALTSLDLSHFNTSKVTTMEEMFGSLNYPAMKVLDLSSFVTTSLTNTKDMFNFSVNFHTTDGDTTYYYEGLEKIIFNKATFSNVTEYTDMFAMDTNDSTSTFDGPLEIVVKDNTAKNWIRARMNTDLGTNNGTVTVG